MFEGAMPYIASGMKSKTYLLKNSPLKSKSRSVFWSNNHSRTISLIVLPVLVFCNFAAAVEEHDRIAEHPSAREIVDRAIAVSERQYDLNVEAMFESLVFSSTQSLDGEDEVTKTELTTHRQYPLNGALFDELVEKDGRPLSEKERHDEEERKQDFIREVEERIERGDHPQPEKGPGIRFNQELMSRYLVEVVGAENVRGHDCWVIAFKPREGDLPIRNRMDRALNQCTGMLWVSKDDYGVARLEFALDKPFKFWGGFIAVIRKTDGRLDNVRVEPDIWLPTSFELKLDLKLMMVKSIRRLMTKKWTDYRRANGDTPIEAMTREDSVAPLLPLQGPLRP